MIRKPIINAVIIKSAMLAMTPIKEPLRKMIANAQMMATNDLEIRSSVLLNIIVPVSIFLRNTPNKKAPTVTPRIPKST